MVKKKQKERTCTNRRKKTSFDDVGQCSGRVLDYSGRLVCAGVDSVYNDIIYTVYNIILYNIYLYYILVNNKNIPL